MKDLIIIGAGGFGRETAWMVERINKENPEWNLLGFIDDDTSKTGKIINGYEVLGTVNALQNFADAYVVCAVGASKVRKSIIDRIKESYPNIKFAAIIDPAVQMSNTAKIGEGSIICVNSVLSVDIEIGNYVIVNFGCTVGHDAVLSDFVTVYPGVNISGSTVIGYCSELGTGMQIIQGKTVGEYTIVGAGAVVVRDMPDKCTAVGNPAKPIKFFE